MKTVNMHFLPACLCLPLLLALGPGCGPEDLPDNEAALDREAASAPCKPGTCYIAKDGDISWICRMQKSPKNSFYFIRDYNDTSDCECKVEDRPSGLGTCASSASPDDPSKKGALDPVGGEKEEVKDPPDHPECPEDDPKCGDTDGGEKKPGGSNPGGEK